MTKLLDLSVVEWTLLAAVRALDPALVLRLLWILRRLLPVLWL